MNTRTNASPGRLAVGAVLLILAATASGCGTALPTQPQLDSGASIQRGTVAAQIADADGPLTLDDTLPPSGGADQTSMPPAGEENFPSLTHNGNGVAHAWGHSKNKHAGTYGSGQRGTTTTQRADGDGSQTIDDPVVPAGGADQTQLPPAGEETLPSLTHPGNGTGPAWGYFKPKKNR